MNESGTSSVVERGLAMPEVAGSSPASRSIIKPGWCESPWGTGGLLHDWPLIRQWLARCETLRRAGCALVPWPVFAPGGDEMPFEPEPGHFVVNSRGEKLFRGLVVLIGRGDVGLITCAHKPDLDHPCVAAHAARLSVCRSHWAKPDDLRPDAATPAQVASQRSLFA